MKECKEGGIYQEFIEPLTSNGIPVLGNKGIETVLAGKLFEGLPPIV